jgi:hypothetical protein
MAFSKQQFPNSANTSEAKDHAASEHASTAKLFGALLIPTTVINKAPNSLITGGWLMENTCQIILMSKPTVFSERRMIHLNIKKMILFLKYSETNPEYALSPEIKTKFIEVFGKYLPLCECNNDSITQDDVNKMYQEFYKNILLKQKQAMQSNKTLLVLLGEHHEESLSMLQEVIAINITRRLGVNKLHLESLPQSNDKRLSDARFSSDTLSFILAFAEKNKLQLAGMETEIQSNSNHYSQRDLRYVDYLCQLQNDITTEEKTPSYKIPVLVNFGALHLQGVIENEKTQANFVCCAFNTINLNFEATQALFNDAKERDALRYTFDPNKVYCVRSPKKWVNILDNFALCDMVAVAEKDFLHQQSIILKTVVDAIKVSTQKIIQNSTNDDALEIIRILAERINLIENNHHPLNSDLILIELLSILNATFVALIKKDLVVMATNLSNIIAKLPSNVLFEIVSLLDPRKINCDNKNLAQPECQFTPLSLNSSIAEIKANHRQCLIM